MNVMSDNARILEANQAFYKALEALDLDAMAACWAQRPTDVCIHPGWEILVGWSAIAQSWKAIFSGAGVMSFDIGNLHIERLGEVARVTCVETIFAVLAVGLTQSTVAATNLFLETDEGWRMIHHHGSVLSNLVQEIDDAGVN